MACFNRITQNRYNAIKILLNGGASVAEAAAYMEVSSRTVYNIKNTQDYDEYCLSTEEKKLEQRARQAKQKEPEKVVTDDKQKGGTMSANYQINRIYEQLKCQNELLTAISNKLAFIVESLA